MGVSRGRTGLRLASMYKVRPSFNSKYLNKVTKIDTPPFIHSLFPPPLLWNSTPSRARR